MSDGLEHSARGSLGRLDKLQVDLERLRAIRSLRKEAKRYFARGEQPPWPQECWLYFPEPRVSRFELRYGKQPPDRDRPSWLKGLDLSVDTYHGMKPQDLLRLLTDSTCRKTLMELRR